MTFDAMSYIAGKKSGGGGGGGDITVEPLSVTSNGTTTAPTGKAYSPVVVNVPNTYAAGDEGKVVSNGALVAQTTHAEVTQNGTVDTTLNNSVTVNVPNSYTAGDEGKVVSNGALVAQTAHATVTQNGTVDTTLNNSVVVNVSGGGGTEVPSKDVNFIDYDGTIVASYSAADFAQLSALPANPSHSGLTAQGWNWTLADAKTYVASYGFLDIGQMYITDDGKTYVYCHFEEPRLSPNVCLYVNGTITIDWGDNTTADTLTGTNFTQTRRTQHTYAAGGDYVITLTPSNGTEFRLAGSTSGTAWLICGATGFNYMRYCDSIKEVRIGSGTSTIYACAFKYCSSLERITLPKTITAVGQNFLDYCYSLKYITIPNAVTELPQGAIAHCENMEAVSLPKSITSMGNTCFSSQYRLRRIAFPPSMSVIPENVIVSNFSLEKVVIPSGITSIGKSAFNALRALKTINIPNTVTTIGDNAFDGSRHIESLIFPNSVTSMGAQVCYNMESVQNITLPNTITAISKGLFQQCYCLTSISIPSTVTTIAASAFTNCYTLGYIRFASSSPPTVDNSNAFSGVPTDCKIYVPTGSLSAYTSATNYPSSSTYTYVEY